MTQECAREAWTVNGYGGGAPGSRHCVDYRTVGTGRYADPEVYGLHQRLDASTTRDMMGGIFGAMKQGGDPASGTRRMTDIAVYAKNDMPDLLQANGCASPSVKRFQANLIRYGEGKDPIVMPGGIVALAEQRTSAGAALKGQNHQRLIDDLITEQSQAWMMNRYQQGSVRPAAPTLDAQGRPREVVASYGYRSMDKSYSGKVRVTFLDGVPQCLYFADIPDACRVPSPRVVSAYRKNQYAEEAAPGLASPEVTASPAPAAIARPPEAAAPAPMRPPPGRAPPATVRHPSRTTPASPGPRVRSRARCRTAKPRRRPARQRVWSGRRRRRSVGAPHWNPTSTGRASPWPAFRPNVRSASKHRSPGQRSPMPGSAIVDGAFAACGPSPRRSS